MRFRPAMVTAWIGTCVVCAAGCTLPAPNSGSSWSAAATPRPAEDLAGVKAAEAAPASEAPAPSAEPEPEPVPAPSADLTDAPQAVSAASSLKVVNTEWGPLTAADRDLLVKVRLAGLWEIPTGKEASERASRVITRKNLGEISRQHVTLDADVRKVAAQLRVPLPNEPNADQQDWMAEISAKKGFAYDKTAVMRLRQAHGKVFPAIATVRATTRNTLIRAFADRCSTFVNTHMALLEGTGLAGADAMPPAPTPSSAPAPIDHNHPAPSAPPATSLLNG
jgi:predicted outer membrane protein